LGAREQHNLDDRVCVCGAGCGFAGIANSDGTIRRFHDRTVRGRSDFQQGDPRVLYRSITEQILTLPESCLLYPGHDYNGRTVTSVAEEQAFNARLGAGADERDFVEHMANMKLPHPQRIGGKEPPGDGHGREGSQHAAHDDRDSVPAPRILHGHSSLRRKKPEKSRIRGQDS
jgi:hypothetical protein